MPVAGSSPGQASVGVYITYVRKEDAAKAIAAIDGSIWDGKILRYKPLNTGSIGANSWNVAFPCQSQCAGYSDVSGSPQAQPTGSNEHVYIWGSTLWHCGFLSPHKRLHRSLSLTLTSLYILERLMAPPSIARITSEA